MHIQTFQIAEDEELELDGTIVHVLQAVQELEGKGRVWTIKALVQENEQEK